MSVLISDSTRVMVQGITGHQGAFHTAAMLEMDTKVVAGVTPGRGGSQVAGVPVFDSVEEAVAGTGCNAAVVFVPARNVLDAVIEDLEQGMELIVVISEHVPQHDAIQMIQYAKFRGARVLGPNCPGVASSRIGKLGIMPNMVFRQGSTGVVSRSGTLTYEIVSALTEAGIGQSTCVGIGGDPVVGTDFVEVLSLMQDDPETERVVLVGEIGGTAEEEAAEYVAKHMTKPVVAYVAGRTAPPGKRMGHAGAIISRGRGTAESKIASLESAGVKVAVLPTDVPKLIRGQG
jgi:succinyl-CoA synthetase alpha subunit